ncbi:MAG: ABC transporter substrate-binding protein [Burkholderiales bacterium]|jgi:NitT/TauT family transport system substrate-binding protein|nr:ABC transporter substrate-binding protein [Burkholderiales bacterium]
MNDLNTPAPWYRRLLTRKLPVIAAALIAALLIAVWVRFATQPARQPEKLVIAHASQPSFALIYIAAARGYFEEEGLNVELQPHTLGRNALNSVIEGKADIATAFGTPVVRRIYEWVPLGIIASLHTSTRNQAIVARRDRGISTATDLEGKRIGVTLGASMEYLLHLLLAAESIPAFSVRKISVEPENFEAAITGGEIDALVVFGAHLQSLQDKLGKERLAVFYSDLYIETSMLVGMREKLLANPVAMQRLLKAVLRAHAYIQTNPEESLEIVIRELAKQYPETAIRLSWPALRFDIELDNLLLSLLTQEARWMRDAGAFKTPVPDFRDFVMTEFLHAVKPDATTLHIRTD